MGLSDCVDRWRAVSCLNGSNTSKVRYFSVICTKLNSHMYVQFITISPYKSFDRFFPFLLTCK